jgi:dimethylsulfoniopropionate demethylase
MASSQPPEDAHHLAHAVQVWRLEGERHLEVTGPGADALMAAATPRDLARVPDGRRAYAPFCGPSGRLLGDPMVHRVGVDAWRLSGAADLAAWIRTLAQAMRVPVLARPASTRGIAVQGPLAEELVGRVLGAGAAGLGPMEWGRTTFGREEIVVARSDLTRQGGFELLVEGRTEPLRRALLETGRDLDARAAAPSELARVEGGILRWGTDLRPDMTPLEAGLGRLCDGTHDHVGRDALRAEGEPGRVLRSLEVEGPPLPAPEEPWPAAGGRVSSAAWAPARGLHAAIGLVAADMAPGGEIAVETPHGRRAARVRDGFWT